MRTALLLWFLAVGASIHAAADRPNIVFVLFDDMGWGQPQCYNPQSALRTPHLDRLASQGMRFTDAHSASAVCTPTRYGVLTGRYPWRIGQFGVLTTHSKPIIPPARMTVASLLRQHGYTTACIGKWHLGMDWADGKPGSEKELPIGARMTGGPNAVGFDYFHGFTHARNIGSIIEQDRVVANVPPVENQPLMIGKAVEWISRQKAGEPFFLYFPMCPPHEPIVPAPDFAGKSGAQDLVRKNPKYGDWVFQGDAMLGQIMEALDRAKLAGNTLLIATSDNGAEQRAYEPLRESKRSIYEGGHRVPCIVRWPGRVKPGSVNDHTICLNDLMATAAGIVGAKLPDDAAEDSVSLIPELTGAATDGVREATVHQAMDGSLAIRRGPWKAIFHKDGRRELYNLRADLGETKDVLPANAEIAANMTALMQDYITNGRSTPGAAQRNDFDPSITGVAAARKTATAGAPGRNAHDTRLVAGWTVHVRAQLIEQDAPALEKAMQLLRAQLDEIVRVVPKSAVAELRKVPLWISPEYPETKPRAEFHPDAGWLSRNGRDPVMAKAVEFTNVRIFEAETRRMPNFALHELAHAYHDRVIEKGFGNPDIKAAYEKAKAAGIYERVERQDSEGRKRMDRAYALQNPQEYFAECTEAFFTRNDFFPYTREQLKQHDPQMFALLGRLWNIASP